MHIHFLQWTTLWLLLSSSIAWSAEPQLPVLEYQPAAVYPPGALETGQSAEVLLELDVAADGLVLDARVVESAGEAFDAAALQAARSFQFTPATDENGEPVSARIRYRYRFTVAKAKARSIEGIVANPDTEEPLEGIRVRVTSANGEVQTATTDAKESLPSRASTTETGHSLRMSKAANPGETEVTVRDGKVSTVALYPDTEMREVESGLEIIVEARRPTVEVTERVLTTEEIQYLPGTAGDVVRVVQNFPGVTVPTGCWAAYFPRCRSRGLRLFLRRWTDSDGVSLLGTDYRAAL